MKTLNQIFKSKIEALEKAITPQAMIDALRAEGSPCADMAEAQNVKIQAEIAKLQALA